MTDIEMPEIIKTDNEVEARKHLFQRKNKRKEIIVPVPEWGMEVLICAISGTARGEYYAFNNAIGEQYRGTGEFFKRIWFKQVQLGCLHPETRQPILQDADRDELMDSEDGVVIEALASIVRDISGLSVSAIDDVKKKLLANAKDTATISSLNGSTAKV